jgi:hypothetical protein
MNESDSSRTQSWNNRWALGKVPWDLGGIPPTLVSFLIRTRTPTHALIPF